jgi:hypothetical protein
MTWSPADITWRASAFRGTREREEEEEDEEEELLKETSRSKVTVSDPLRVLETKFKHTTNKTKQSKSKAKQRKNLGDCNAVWRDDHSAQTSSQCLANVAAHRPDLRTNLVTARRFDPFLSKQLERKYKTFSKLQKPVYGIPFCVKLQIRGRKMCGVVVENVFYSRRRGCASLHCCVHQHTDGSLRTTAAKVRVSLHWGHDGMRKMKCNGVALLQERCEMATIALHAKNSRIGAIIQKP